MFNYASGRSIQNEGRKTKVAQKNPAMLVISKTLSLRATLFVAPCRSELKRHASYMAIRKFEKLDTQCEKNKNLKLIILKIAFFAHKKQKNPSLILLH
ncbi:hypothetical protein [Marinomonas rhizomae]|nr:hypothetical protein [Marinomonas rhizomae]